MADTPRRTVRVSDEDWSVMTEEAKRLGVSTTELMLRGFLRPSFSGSVRVLTRAVVTPEARDATVSLAGEAGVQEILASDLRVLASGLNALATRWPR